MVTIGFHTDAFNSIACSFRQAVDWAKDHNVERIECGAIDGVAWIHGLGYYPHIALWEDPIELREYMEKRNVKLSQIDAAFPLTIQEGTTLGIQYIKKTISWAKLAGCKFVDTTDNKGKMEGYSDGEVLKRLIWIYEDILKTAETHQIVVNIEPHGYYTTKPDFMYELFSHFSSPYLRLNMDTGNTYIAGQDPVAFLEKLKKYVSHVHIKDISKSLADSLRGKATGIALSHCAIGYGVNADNIKKCLTILAEISYDGNLSIESEGSGEILEKGVAWLKKSVKEIF